MTYEINPPLHPLAPIVAYVALFALFFLIAMLKLTHIETGVVKMFRLSGKDGMTYASAEAAKGAVERTWESHGGKYGKR